MTTHPVVILDFGSQTTQLIARRIREMGVYCELHPLHVPYSTIAALQPVGVILSGGPASVTLTDGPRIPDWVFQLNVPVLGICYGMQALAAQLGGHVTPSALREFGYAQVLLQGEDALLKGLHDHVTASGVCALDVWMSHGDHVTALPPGFHVMASTANTPIAAMADETRRWYGVQFHPEVTHTVQGMAMLTRFVLDICQAQQHWTPGEILEQTVASVREQVGGERVLLALSGGVDSSVVAALLQRAIGEQLVCVFVDTGLLRLNEATQVKEMFGERLGSQLIMVDASDRFLMALRGVTCPEEKRKIIGRTFIEVFEDEANRLSGMTFLAQGTIYPDVIESAATSSSGTTDVIKSHHNVGGLPDTMQLKLLEPIRALFKDEVRKLGLALGLPYEMVYRHPFPGPGLGVRILGEVIPDYVDTLRRADAIFIQALRDEGLYHQVSQAFAVFLPVKSVGVIGDRRCYSHVICLRAVVTEDFMTAHWAQLPWDFLGNVSNRIINEVEGISRVTYDVSGKPPATIEWE